MCASPHRTTILVVALGRFVDADPDGESKWGPNALAKQSVAEAMSQARIAGYDCHRIDINPLDPAASLAEFEQRLRAQRYDGLIVGFGLRGSKEFTALFEELVNCAVRLCPRVRFGFSPAPQAVFETLERVWPRAD